MGKTKDYTGVKFGKLIVIERLPHERGKKTRYKCRCDCGNYSIVSSSNLATGHCTSCGCSVKKHGLAKKERLYTIWVVMRQRCRDTDRKNYGGRGIKVCDEWQNYSKFREWALSHGYADNLSIDRINVNGNYEPSNCRWANAKQQALNKRNNHLLAYKGKSQTIVQWAEEIGISRVTLLTRIRRGWSVERAIETPIKSKGR